MENIILIELVGKKFFLSGDLKLIFQNRRLLLSFRRLGFSELNRYIEIHFEEKTKIQILQDIQDLLEKFDIKYHFHESVRTQISAYNNEQENFKIFTKNAKEIRNNTFSDNIELMEGFEIFKNVLNNSLKRTLYPMQMLSSFHMAFSQNSCNFAVPGAGKTSIVYGAYAYLKSLPKNNPKHVNKIVVIGPLSSFAPWENEYKDCFGKIVESQRLSGDASILLSRKKQHLYSSNPKELTLISHAGVSIFEKEIVDFLKQNKAMVIVDEAHRIKKAEGIWGQSAVEISKEASSRIVLTGTPIPNGYEDLYNLYRFIYPFKFRDILQIHYDQLRDLTKCSISNEDDRVKKFIDNIKPYFIRIKKKDLNLPKVIENIVLVDMDEHQRIIYDFIEEKYIKSFVSNSSGTVKDVLNKAKLIRLRQAATNPALLAKTLRETLEHSENGDVDSNYHFAEIDNETIDDSSIFAQIKEYQQSEIPKKFKAIKEIFETKIIPISGKVIVWTIFIQNAEELQDYLKNNGIKSKLLIGKVPQEEREEIIGAFNNENNLDFKVVIANPFAVSESISLHKGCHNAIYMERDYNCANFLQSKDRIHRVGLPENTETNYYYLISKNSIDSIINEKLDEKIKRMEKIIDEDIPLFARINDSDETDIIKSLLDDYARRSQNL